MPKEQTQTITPKTKKLETINGTNHNPLFTKFWQELRTGKGIKKEGKDLKELVECYMDVEPITSLTEEEKTKIKEYLARFFTLEIEEYNEKYLSLINDEILLVDDQDQDLDIFHRKSSTLGVSHSLLNISQLSTEEEYRVVIEALLKKGIKPLTIEEKVNLFSNPEVLNQIQYYIWRANFSWAYNASFEPTSRRLDRGYYSSNEEF